MKVLDFGLAKWLPRAPFDEQDVTLTDPQTVPGQILGTVAYMSPEQILGQDSDQRGDLFAFGIMLHEILTGQHPWPRRSAVDTMHAILHDGPASLGDISASLTPIVQRLLRKKPADRFASVEEVREALAAGSATRESRPAAGKDAEPLRSIAVLPFLFLNEIENRKAYSLGFADALITTLGSAENLAVLPTSAIVNYAPGVDPARTCQDLGVRHVFQGSVQKQGNHWRVSTQLFDGNTRRITYSERHDFVLENVFEVQDEIGRRVLESLQMRLKPTAPKCRPRYHVVGQGRIPLRTCTDA